MVLVIFQRYSHDLRDEFAQREVLVYEHVEESVGDLFRVDKVLGRLILEHVVQHGLEASRLQLKLLLHLNQVQHELHVLAQVHGCLLKELTRYASLLTITQLAAVRYGGVFAEEHGDSGLLYKRELVTLLVQEVDTVAHEAQVSKDDTLTCADRINLVHLVAVIFFVMTAN